MAADAYRNRRIRIWWDGRYVAGFDRLGALRRTAEVIESREGGEPNDVRKLAGPAHYDAIVLEHGTSQDAEFEQWADAAWNPAPPQGAAAGLRKDLRIDVFDELDRLTVSYKVLRAWVSEYQALPELDANANAIAMAHIRLENEGWQRDAPEP